MSEAIMVRGLTKTYGDRVVVNNLDLSVKSGTVFGLLGANGAGKSTTIECILKHGTPVFYGTVEEAKKRCGCEHFEDAYLMLSDEEAE